MQNKRKIINDPVFGFINIPNDFIYHIIQHRYFQRLNRIKQLGLSSFVYPGAQHTRMLHSLGAMYLMGEALKQLQQHGNEITNEEFDAAMAAILLHDIGHGPFSHALENTLVSDISHEEISLMLMQKINEELNGKLDLTIKIFKNEYHKKFLHQLVSGQLDVDRLDYLRRDSFFSGVTEGIIGSARIIKMLNVKNDDLVVEEKGIYSIENFLFARRFMYWQVYYHKTSVAAESMLIKILQRAKFLSMNGFKLFATPSLHYFLENDIDKAFFVSNNLALESFVSLDDSDILSTIKVWTATDDKVLSELCRRFVNRQLFRSETTQEPVTEERKRQLVEQYQQHFGISEEDANYFWFEECVSPNTYNYDDEKILILYRDGSLHDITEASDILNVKLLKNAASKYYLCYLKL